MREEINNLKAKIEEIERKYSFMHDYRLITTILDKLGIEEIEILRSDIEKNKTMFVAINEEVKVIIKRED